jgi:hypothetical protein
MKMGHIAGKLTMLTRLDELLVSYDVTLCPDTRNHS